MKLKSCPFCGCKPKIETYQDPSGFLACISCPSCWASVHSKPCRNRAVSIARAKAKWNRRHVFYPRDLYEICFGSLESCDEPEWTFYNKIMEAVSEYEYRTALKSIDISRYDTDIDF